MKISRPSKRMKKTRNEPNMRRGHSGHALILAIALFITACGGNESILRSGKEPTPQANTDSQKTTFEKDLEAMRTAEFSFIYVLRRKDGETLDAQDRSVIKLQTDQINRRVTADDGRAVILGSNFLLTDRNMAVLNERFAVENFSPSPSTAINSNANTNAGNQNIVR